MDRKLDFVIVGAQKSATTALYDFLQQHPDIFLPRTKEIHYFAQDEFYRLGDSYLDTYYRELDDQPLVGSAYAHLMYFPKGAGRIYQHNPEARILAVLRNPIDRAWSAYWFARRNGWETLPTFEQALQREPERLLASFEERAELTYVSHGHYAEQLEPYFRLFGKERVKVLLTNDLADGAMGTVVEVLAWLGLNGDATKIDVRKRLNVAGMPRFPGLQRLLQSARVRRLLRRSTPASVRFSIREFVIKPILRLNVDRFEYPEMDPATRTRLSEYFEPHNRRLERLIERDLSHWR